MNDKHYKARILSKPELTTEEPQGLYSLNQQIFRIGLIICEENVHSSKFAVPRSKSLWMCCSAFVSCKIRRSMSADCYQVYQKEIKCGS
jgi:hypothetical protein